ncbi:MAG: ATP synthase F0 subunit C [Candidatus Latescibacter sp.]|nr:ATP synthase F0 subunit C [Candidatus Latescibacter sp.]
MDFVILAKYVGASIAVGIGGLGSGFGEGLTAGKAAQAISRQPKISGEILRTMLITQAVTETSGIFGLMVAILLLFVAPTEGEPSKVTAFIAAGICMGVGGIGAGIGCGMAGSAACESVARHPRISSSILLNTLVGQAVTQTGCIFALVISLLLIFIAPDSSNIGTVGAVLGAGLCMGIGALGPGLGEGFAAGKACDAMSRASELAPVITRTMLIGQAVTESVVIYAFVVALLLILVAK